MISLQALSAVAVLIISLGSDALAAHLPFNPREYPKNVVSCPAINHAENTGVDIELRTGSSLFVLLRHKEEAVLIRNISQTTLRSIPRPKRRCFSSTVGLVYGRAGNIRYKSFRWRSAPRPSCSRELIFSSFRMSTTSSHRTFVALARRHTQVTSSHLAQCPTWSAISCVFWSMLVFRKQSQSGT